MIEITPRNAGVEISLKVRPGARRNALDGEHAGALKLSVTAAPEKGKANDAVIALLAEEIGISRSNVMITRGATSTTKTASIAGIDEAELRLRLEQSLAKSAAKKKGK